jgi:hypothetical protein
MVDNRGTQYPDNCALPCQTPAVGVSDCVSRTAASCNGRKTNKHGSLSFRILQEFRLGVRLHTLVSLKVALCPRSLGMDNPLGDAFPVKMSRLLNELNIL